MEEPITVQLKVISCRDLNSFNFFQKLSTYVVVSIVDLEDPKKKKKDQSLQLEKTPVDSDGGINPEWNHEIVFDLRELSVSGRSTLFLKFDIRCKGVMFGNKTVGEVCVPLEDLIDEFNEALRFVSYQVRSTDGDPNGVLNFSYKVNGKKGGLKKKEKTENGYPIDRVSYPTVEVDFRSGGNSNPSPAEISFLSHQQKCYYPTLEVLEEMKLQSLSPMAPWGYYQSPQPGERNGYFGNSVGHCWNSVTDGEQGGKDSGGGKIF